MYKAGLIRNRDCLDEHGPWQDIDTVDVATAEWVHTGSTPSALTQPSACAPPPSTKPPGPPTPTTTTTARNNHGQPPPAPDKPASTKLGA